MNESGCLLDTGPLVALLYKDDQDHERAKALFEACQSPLQTCEAVIAEACFLLRKMNPLAPEEVLALGREGVYEISFSLQQNLASIQESMRKYRDHPISLADACLIRCAELYNEPRILTFDSDFEIYRWEKRKKFEIL